MITRIGCYLFGCDFGKRLPDGAPQLAQDARHVPALGRGHARERRGQPRVRAAPRGLSRHAARGRAHPKMNSSFPVHPTQIYESLVGLALLGPPPLAAPVHALPRAGLLPLRVRLRLSALHPRDLARRRRARRATGPTLDEHVYIPLCLLLMALGFVFGISLGIANKRARTRRARARVRAAARGVHRCCRPAELRADACRTSSRRASSSACCSALVVSFFYARYWEDARKNPKLAMSLGDVASIRRLRGESGRRGSARASPMTTRPSPRRPDGGACAVTSSVRLALATRRATRRLGTRDRPVARSR